MCLIAVHPAASPLTDNECTEAYYTNPDGMGAMWADGPKVVIRRALPTTEDAAVAFYREVNAEASGATIVWHWRYTTHGGTSLANTHPFRVRADSAIVHNGVIPGYGDGAHSDTSHFVRTHLAGRLERKIDWAQIGKLTTGSRLAYLEADGGQGTPKVTLIGSGWSETPAGIHLSNTYWRWDEPAAVKAPKARRARVVDGLWAMMDGPNSYDAVCDVDASLREAIDMVESLCRYDGTASVWELCKEVASSYTADARMLRLLESAYAPQIAAEKGWAREPLSDYWYGPATRKGAR